MRFNDSQSSIRFGGTSPPPCSYARYAPQCSTVQYAEQYTVINLRSFVITKENNNKNANEQIEELITGKVLHTISSAFTLFQSNDPLFHQNLNKFRRLAGESPLGGGRLPAAHRWLWPCVWHLSLLDFGCSNGGEI